MTVHFSPLVLFGFALHVSAAAYRSIGQFNCAVAQKQLLEDEVQAGIPPDRIVLMGFSQVPETCRAAVASPLSHCAAALTVSWQGAGVALAAALDLDGPIAGVVALSPLLPPSLVRLCGLRDAADADAQALARVRAGGGGLRVLVCEGALDRVAPGAFGRPLYTWMTEQGARVQVEAWAEMGHEVALEELCRVREFLCQVLPAQPSASDAAMRMWQGPGTGADKDMLQVPAPSAPAGADGDMQGRAARFSATTERESAAANGAREALARFVQGWSDPAAAVWAQTLQRSK